MSRPPGIWLHAIVSSLAMMAGMSLVGLGAYLKIIDPIQNIELEYTKNPTMKNILSVSLIALICGSSMVLLSILGILVSKGTGFRFSLIAYTIVGLCVIAVLGFVATVAVLISSGHLPFGLYGILEQAWENTVANNKDKACKIQKDFKCLGFSDSSCVGCNSFNTSGAGKCSAAQARKCPWCQNGEQNTTMGCFGAILNGTKKYCVPTGIASGIGGGLLLVDLGVVYML